MSNKMQTNINRRSCAPSLASVADLALLEPCRGSDSIRPSRAEDYPRTPLDALAGSHGARVRSRKVTAPGTRAISPGEPQKPLRSIGSRDLDDEVVYLG